jgi:hypothetical protein
MDVPGCAISHRTIPDTHPADEQTMTSLKRSGAAQGSETPVTDPKVAPAAMAAKRWARSNS